MTVLTLDTGVDDRRMDMAARSSARLCREWTGSIVTMDALNTTFSLLCLASSFSFSPSLSRHVSLCVSSSVQQTSSAPLEQVFIRALFVSILPILPHLRILFVSFVLYFSYLFSWWACVVFSYPVR